MEDRILWLEDSKGIGSFSQGLRLIKNMYKIWERKHKKIEFTNNGQREIIPYHIILNIVNKAIFNSME